MVSVEEAEKIISRCARTYGVEHLPFEAALGRVLAGDIVADRDLPACNKATMDGIAVQYSSIEKGIGAFNVIATIAAGAAPIMLNVPDGCVEIMTGCGLPDSADTVIRYEDLNIEKNTAILLNSSIKKGQNVHHKGKDKKEGETVAPAGAQVTPVIVSLAASVGKIMLPVRRTPEVIIISTGDELIDAGATPTPYQVRQSNSYLIKCVLHLYGIEARTQHLPDNKVQIERQLQLALASYDVIILTGGVSMGKYDYVPQALRDLGVTELFHKVQQRPGKPFWFGRQANETLVFAFPGNPVSSFMCLHRYFLPWLEMSLRRQREPVDEYTGNIFQVPEIFAVLDCDVAFSAPLKYFVQVKLRTDKHGTLLAMPAEGNGSGDFANLAGADAFMELPLEKSNFKKGEAYRIWPYKK